MKFKTLSLLAMAGLCVSSLALADTDKSLNKMLLAEDTSSQSAQPSVGGTDSTTTPSTATPNGTDGNVGSSQDAMPSTGDDTSSTGTDTGTGDDDY